MSDTPQDGSPGILLAQHLKKLKMPSFLGEYEKLARHCAAENLDHADRRCAQHWDKVARNAFLKGESGPAPPEIHAASDVYTDVYGKTLAGEFLRKNQ